MKLTTPILFVSTIDYAVRGVLTSHDYYIASGDCDLEFLENIEEHEPTVYQPRSIEFLPYKGVIPSEPGQATTMFKKEQMLVNKKPPEFSEGFGF